MKIIFIDITSKVFGYDFALFEAIKARLNTDDKGLFLTTFYSGGCKEMPKSYKLICMVDKEQSRHNSLSKRVLKAFEAFANYLKLIYIIFSFRPNVLHLQWLPFLEVSKVELLFLKIFRKIRKDMRIVLTVHNMYPHNSNEEKKKLYKERFVQSQLFIDHFIVHTCSSKTTLIEDFNVESSKIDVIRHGAFVPDVIPLSKRHDEKKVRFLMFGNQSYYKGTDLLVHAYNALPKDVAEKIEISIIGQTSPDMAECIQNSTRKILWHNGFLEDDELNQEIADADVLLFPYRAISQSGALLLGLTFQKPVILSALPSFKETFDDYPQQMFVTVDDVQSLCDAMIYYIHSSDEEKTIIKNKLSEILKANSWSKSAEDTIGLYHRLIKT